MLHDVVHNVATGSRASEVLGVHTLVDGPVDGVLDDDGVLLVAQMSQHVHGSVQHRDGICDVLPSDAFASVPGTWLENSVMISVVLAGQETGPAQKSADDIGDDGAVEIRGVDDVELMRIRNELHATIVNDHVVVSNFRVLFCHFSGHFQEETVREFHNVGLVDRGDLLPVVTLGVLKGVTRDSLRVALRDDFHALDHAVDAFVLQHGVLAFGVLSHNGNVYVLLAGFDGTVGHAVEDVDVQIEFVPYGDIAGLDACFFATGFYVSFKSYSVSADGSYGVIDVFVVGGVGVDVDVFKVYRHAGVSKDL